MKFLNAARYILATVGVAALIGIAWLLYHRFAPAEPVNLVQEVVDQVVVPPQEHLRLESVKEGAQYGAWTVASTTMSLREEVNVEDGSKYQALGGEVYFKGGINVRGRYEPNDLEGGVIFYPDKEYYREFPYIVAGKSSENLALRGGILRIGLFGGFVGLEKTYPASGTAMIQLINPIFQKVSCSNCDPWQGFFVEQAVSLIKN